MQILKVLKITDPSNLTSSFGWQKFEHVRREEEEFGIFGVTMGFQ